MTNLPQPIPRLAPRQPEVAVGIALSTREIGYAVATREHLLTHGVWNIRKIHSQEGKEARFRHEVGRLLDRFPTKRLCLVEPPGAVATDPTLIAMRTWLTAEVARRSIALHGYDRAAVRDSLRNAPTHRTLARELADRFPQLKRLLRQEPARGQLVPDMVVRFEAPSARERYWSGMFLALAAALRPLDLAWQRQLAYERPQQPTTDPSLPGDASQ